MEEEYRKAIMEILQSIEREDGSVKSFAQIGLQSLAQM